MGWYAPSFVHRFCLAGVRSVPSDGYAIRPTKTPDGLGTMMRQLKTILLNQYIGAIAIGYMIGRGVEASLAAFMPTFNAILTQALRGQPFVEDPLLTARVSLISNLFLAGLYFLIAFLAVSWLYAKPVSDDSA